MTPNPLARRRRLGAAIFDLRRGRGLSHTKLAELSGVSGSVISRMENPLGDIARRHDILLVRQILAALGVPRGHERFDLLDTWAEEASTSRWWDTGPFARMGTGQRWAAIVECGACEVNEYSGLLLPGMVQTPEYARHVAADLTGGDDRADVDAIVAGRMERQRLITEYGATYRLLFEEQAVRRSPVPPAVMLAQLRHLLALAELPKVELLVLPVAAQQLGQGPVPKSPFSHIAYPERDDPPIVTVDNVTKFSLVTDPADVEGYAKLHKRLRHALSSAESAAFIRGLANSLAASATT